MNKMHRKEEKADSITILYFSKYGTKTETETFVSNPVAEKHKTNTCPCLTLKVSYNKLQLYLY
jgi:hypothetical protein